MKGKNIIVVGQQPWDIEIGSNAKNIALEFSKDNHVLYVNAPLDRVTRFKNRKDPRVKKRVDILRGKEPDLVQLDDNLWNLYPKMIAESVNWVSHHGWFRKLNKRNNKKFADTILDATNRLGFTDFVLFNDSLMMRGFHLKEFLRPEAYIYYIRDYLIIQPYFKKHGERIEAELIKKSDLVVANSTYLQEYANQFNHKSYYVGQGCEVSMFDESKVEKLPEDVKNIPQPIIGYVGYLTSMRLDIDLLVHFAKTKKDFSLVLVGPEDEAFKTSELHQLENVFFLGPKDPQKLPQYVKSFDVCINPQIVNMLTIGNYPRKIDEYLAMGKPVVATKTKAMEVFSEFTYLSESKENFVELIENALKEDTEELHEQRKVFAASHTWANSVNEIYKAIENGE